MSYLKGVAQTITFPLVDLNSLGVSGKTLTATVSKDGSTFVPSTNAVTEVSGGGGQYKLTLTALERTADEVVVRATDGILGTKVTFYPSTSATAQNVSEAQTTVINAILTALPDSPDNDSIAFIRKLLANQIVDNGTEFEVYDDDDTLLGSFIWTEATGTRSKFNEA